MSARITDCLRLAAFVDEHGGQLPDVMRRALDAHAAIEELRRTTDDPRTQLDSLVRSGALTKDKVAKVVADAARRQSEAEAARDVAETLSVNVVRVFEQELAGDGGDALTESLRPAFDADLAEVQRLCVLPAGMTADAAIERGPEFVEAWQAAPAAARSMEQWYSWAVLLHREFKIPAGGGNFQSHPGVPFAAYFVTDPAVLHTAAVALAVQPGTAADRLGRFGRLHRTGATIRLNSPREAAALVTDHDDAAAEKYERHAAWHESSDGRAAAYQAKRAEEAQRDRELADGTRVVSEPLQPKIAVHFP